MPTEKWNEICFLLSENIKETISETDFEQKVIQALRVLNWKEYLGEIEVRPSLHIGAVNRIAPDILIKKGDKKAFVIEIKRPDLQFNPVFQQQLFSYMRQLKLDYGLLIGQAIQIFYDGDLKNQEDPVLLEIIRFVPNDEKGINFVKLFSKDTFDEEALKKFTLTALDKINRKEDYKKLKEIIRSAEFRERISEMIKQEFLNDYDGELIDSVMADLKIEISPVLKQPLLPSVSASAKIGQNNQYNSSGILPITLNPPSESEFKRRLLITRTAWITTYYKNGTSRTAIWNAHRFSESSGVLGNLRSRPQFRNGEWQKLGIERVWVSIDKHEL
ncbi:MAG TPA: hypothetical protein VFF21_03245 [Flavobacteriaceae bacterium]|nr:hypothetical protein [Flavobacteriaceae bacterium]